MNKPSQAYKLFSGKLNKWRHNFIITAYKNNKNSHTNGNKYKFIVSTLFSGGLTDTISAIRCEFRPLWGAEYNRDLCNMWSFLTNIVCHKDVFSKSVEETTSPNYLSVIHEVMITTETVLAKGVTVIAGKCSYDYQR